MSAALQPREDVFQAIVLEQIGIIVRNAQSSGTMLRTVDHAASLFASYPQAGWSMGHIIDELIMAASAASVPVEIGRPGPESA